MSILTIQNEDQAIFLRVYLGADVMDEAWEGQDWVEYITAPINIHSRTRSPWGQVFGSLPVFLLCAADTIPKKYPGLTALFTEPALIDPLLCSIGMKIPGRITKERLGRAQTYNAQWMAQVTIRRMLLTQP